MSPVLTHPDGNVRIEQVHEKRSITVEMREGLFAPVRRCVTAYPLELIEHVLRIKGPAYLCDEITRDEDPGYVEHYFRWDILSYVGEEEFAGRRVLDFGSGSGASTMVLARMLPEASIVGVELLAESVELAEHRVRAAGLESRVSIQRSPDPNSLPAGIGQFDYIVLSAVHEHLLPAERPRILALLWSHLQPGGVMFIGQTPHRWFPMEAHTTGLPLINYLPDRVAHFCARRFSGRFSRDTTWPELLRMGIRGGTSREIMSLLAAAGGSPELLAPSRLGVRDPIDLWYRLSSVRKPRVKKLLAWALRAARPLTGEAVVPVLSLAIRKSFRPAPPPVGDR